MPIQARTEFSSALNAIAKERGLDPEVILDTIRQAIVAAYRRDARERGEDTEELQVEANVDASSGEARIMSWKLQEDGSIAGEKQDVTPPGFGRIAAQTAKQVILQKIREAEKEAVLVQYQGRIGQIISGIVLRFDGPNVRVDLGRTEGIMPPQERIPTERLNVNQRLTFLLKEIRETDRGRDIILSRADAELVKKLFAREVPEIGSGAVEVKAIAREAGARTKIAVASNQSGVDPVGSCVGQKGVRVQAVINELNGEKIDVIPFTEDQAQLITSSLAPADGISVILNEEKREAKVKIPEDKLSLAIGKEGQNVRLAVKLTGWRIEIEGVKVEKTEGQEEKVQVQERTEKTPELETETKDVGEQEKAGGEETSGGVVQPTDDTVQQVEEVKEEKEN